MVDLKSKFEQSINYVKKRFGSDFDIAIVLGSGLGNFAHKVNVKETISVNDIPGYPLSTVEGHKGALHLVEEAGKKVLLFQGRVHFYEGYNLSDCLIQTQIGKELGAKYFFLTNAAGGINLFFKPGDLMFVNSFSSINIQKELTETIGVGTLDNRNNIVNFPDPEFKEIIYKSALDSKVILKEGNYWFGKGPSYETPSEVKMIAKLGFDAVGMSTAHEALYGIMLGMKTGIISCITNFAAGMSPDKLSHEEVTITANMAADSFEKLVKKIIENLK
ncbi:MAG: purine nucleoside phosphorylase [Melioribacteraceae bacterium]|nr:MAG: purine nucleoside phosphorylase [Melioribacteraceae bacterium]